ncbi:MAG: 2-dehydropantoate 2-reductase [Candidatus Bathyarchaeota archaeon]|nr:MAG: 2-dehydropantoate 2-reductase [Candidatus Bathyarchaeota archaeon]
MKSLTVGIIGLGPVGSILASHLADYGVDVIVEDIAEELLAQIRKNGLKVSGIHELTADIDRITGSLDELAESEPDIIFIATKACFLRTVLSNLKSVYKVKMKVVSFQNGLGNEQVITQVLGVDTAYRVVINYAGELVSPGSAKMNWFQPPNYVGALRDGQYTTDDTTEYIAEIMTASGLETEESQDIKRHVWKKTILNAALCSVCALTGQTMKEAMELKSSRNVAIRILEEGLRVAEADGYAYGEDALEKFASYLMKGGAHKPSMLVDIENRRKTEVDFLSGAIVNQGKKLGTDAPTNWAVTQLLKTLEEMRLERKHRRPHVKSLI